MLFFSVMTQETVEDSVKIGLDDGGRKDSIHMGASVIVKQKFSRLWLKRLENHLLQICHKFWQFIVIEKVNIYSFITNIQ